MRKPEFSFLIRYYNLLYQSLIPNCKLTIKILKQHLEIPSDVESFIVNGESSRIRCQRVINLLLVQLDTTSNYEHFCHLFNTISVMRGLPDKLFSDSKKPKQVLISSTTARADDCAVDSVIIQCVDIEAPSGIADHSIMAVRRCKAYDTVTPARSIAVSLPPEVSLLKEEKSPIERTTSLLQPTEATDGVSSRMQLEEQLKYDQARLIKGISCPQPPPLPPNYVCRQQLLNEIVNKLFQSTIYTNSYGASLTITGAGGFGKTSIATALCYHQLVEEQFKDGFLFVELGPQATDPSMKLSQLYHLLTGEYLKQGDINHAESELQKLTFTYCRNLLVIIDDVWHVEDAEPIVKAFSNCKIVLTTRMKDIDQYIPTKQVVSVGPMEQTEAISLVTCGVIDVSQLLQEDADLLDELAQDVHLWPLLLSLVRGQLCHSIKRYRSTYHEAIQHVQDKLYDKGLTAFDKNNIERNRKYAVKACIDVTLELLSKAKSDKLKSLILWTGIGTSLQTEVLHILWNVTEYEARDTVDILWTYGLVQFTDILIPPHNNTQHCTEVHAVISHYIIENMESKEVHDLSPVDGLNTGKLVGDSLALSFQKCYGVTVGAIASLAAVDFLMYRQSQVENSVIPFCLKWINMHTITDPHNIILVLLALQRVLSILPNVTIFLPTLSGQMTGLINSCHKILKLTHKLSKMLSQKTQHCLTQGNFHSLIQTVEEYCNAYPVALVAQQAALLVKELLPYCEGELLLAVMRCYESFLVRTPDYHFIKLVILGHVKVLTKELDHISNALLAGSPDTELVHQSILSGKYEQEIKLVSNNRSKILQEIAPSIAHQIASS
ncbi:uncharacterized protein [Dysidea avara]